MSRYKAFAIHFAISFAILVLLTFIIIKFWYPDFTFQLDGGWQGLRLIVFVDMVLGPLLTLIVYKAGKPGLKFDLGAIATFQAVCLVAGMWVVHSERPLAIVYADGHFYSMSKDSYTSANQPVPNLSSFPGSYPKWLRVSLPDDMDAQQEVRGTAFKAHRPLATLSEFYAPLDPASLSSEDAYDLAEIQARDKNAMDLQRFTREHGGDVAEYDFYPLGTRYNYLFLGFAKADRDVRDVLWTPGPL